MNYSSDNISEEGSDSIQSTYCVPSMDGGAALGWHRDPAALLSTVSGHYLRISGSKV